MTRVREGGKERLSPALLILTHISRNQSRSVQDQQDMHPIRSDPFHFLHSSLPLSSCSTPITCALTRHASISPTSSSFTGFTRPSLLSASLASSDPRSACRAAARMEGYADLGRRRS